MVRTYMGILSPREGPPYWLREASAEEMATHKRLMDTLHKLETQSDRPTETIDNGYQETTASKESPPPDQPKRLLTPHPFFAEADNIGDLGIREVDLPPSQGD
jgi:hypothetical protein